VVTSIKKRDGRVEPFNKQKIESAILRANQEVGDKSKIPKSQFEVILKDVCSQCETMNHIPSVEDVQEIVETQLMKHGTYDVAKAYIRYRYQHMLDRVRRADLMNKIGEKIQATNIENQNANVDEMSFGGRKGEADSALMKQWALDNCISKMARENHENNEIYIHDLDSYAVGMHNCLSIPFDDLLANGFNTRQADVRPAQSINTAFQLIAVIFQLQSLQQFGGVSATHLDWTMVPYVRKSFRKHFLDALKYVCRYNDDYIGVEKMWMNGHPDAGIDDEHFAVPEDAYQYARDMTLKETWQAVEGMYHNLNTLQSRSGE
jgi:ribonucleoside-triphosphate reductase (formate)